MATRTPKETAAAAQSRIRIRDATPADVSNILDIHYAAFGLDPMNSLMYPTGVSESARSTLGQSFFPSPKEGEKPKKGTQIVMVAELVAEDDGAAKTVTPEIVAFAKWYYHPQPRTEEEWNDEQPMTQEELGEGVDVQVMNDFIGELRKLRKKHSKGIPALFLGILAASPKCQRIGAGSALVKWGVDLADRESLPAFLEASPMGHPLYRKYGFEDIDVFDYPIKERHGLVRPADKSCGHASPVGGPLPEGVHRTAIMKRPAKKATSTL